MSNFFKMYCYAQINGQATDNALISCAEVSLQANPEVLRQIADFILCCAKKLDEGRGDSMLHFHLRDEWSEWSDECPDLIVCSVPSAT